MKPFKHPLSVQHLLLLSSLSMLSAKTYAADCQFEVTNNWGSGFTAAVTISNTSNETINGWSVTLDFPDGATMGSPWNGSLTETVPYTVVNANYNGTINPGASKSFGFNGDKAVTGVDVVSPTLGGICLNDSQSTLPSPGIQASVTEGELPLTVSFNGTSDIEPEELLDFRWNFGDGPGSNRQQRRTYLH